MLTVDHRPRTTARRAYLRRIPADTETPISVFLKLRRGGTAFLLESAEQDGALGRFSFIGAVPDAVLRAGASGGTITRESGTEAYAGIPQDALRMLAGEDEVLGIEACGVPALAGGLVGALGYDFGLLQERIPHARAADGPLPLALFARYPTVVVYDHRGQSLTIVSVATDDGDGRRWAEARIEQALAALTRSASAPRFSPAPVALSDFPCVPDAARFSDDVRRAREAIHAGELIQVVLSRRFSAACPGDPFRVYRALRTVSPSPYMYYVEFPEVTLVGASPEMLLRVENGIAQLSPIAGTRPRGEGPDDDAANELELLADAKENAEHLMLVDLARNDLGRVCTPGSVHVPRFRQVERFSHVMHLVSTVTGRLAAGHDAVSALASCFPAGTVSGAPKVQAMRMIEEMETLRRGFYAGAVGYLAAGSRALDTCIAIRTAVVRDGIAHVQAGAGIVADSDPAREVAETWHKASSMLTALALAGATPAPPARESAA